MTRQICRDCGQLKKPTELVKDTCADCARELASSHGTMIVQEENGSLARQVASQMASMSSGSRTPAQLAAAFLDLNPEGATSIAKVIMEEIEACRGLSDHERLQTGRTPAVVQRYLSDLMKMCDRHDDRIANQSLETMSETDLYVGLVDVARQLCDEDESFRRDVVLRVLRENPDVLQQSGDTVVLCDEIIQDSTEPECVEAV